MLLKTINMDMSCIKYLYVNLSSTEKVNILSLNISKQHQCLRKDLW